MPRLTCCNLKELPALLLCVPQCIHTFRIESGRDLLSDWCPWSVWERWTAAKASFPKMESRTVKDNRFVKHWTGKEQFTWRPLNAKEFSNSWVFQKKNPKERARSFELECPLPIPKVHETCSPWGSPANMLYISFNGKKLHLGNCISIIQREKMSRGIRLIINLYWYPIVANNRCFRGRYETSVVSNSVMPCKGFFLPRA